MVACRDQFIESPETAVRTIDSRRPAVVSRHRFGLTLFATTLATALMLRPGPVLGDELPPAAQAVPELVLETFARTVTDCESQPAGREDVVRFAVLEDLNRDGWFDWTVRYGWACPEVPAYFCGSGGCETQIFLSDGHGGYVLAVNERLRDYFPHEVGIDKPGLALDRHGSACDRAGYQPCRQVYAIDGTELTLFDDDALPPLPEPDQSP